MKLNRLGSAINRENRIKLNENMSIIENDFNEMNVDVQGYKETVEENSRLVNQANLDASKAVILANAIQDELDSIVVEGDSSVEAAQARTNSDTGETYSSLRERLDEENKTITQQLAHIIVNLKSPPPPMVGAKGDGSDETVLINSIIASPYSRFYFDEGTYGIDGTSQTVTYGGLLFKNDCEITFSPKAYLNVIPTDRDHYSAINLVGLENVKIYNPKIKGERNHHITSTSQGKSTSGGQDGFNGEWGHGIRISACKNIEIYNPISIDCWGDGTVIDGLSDNISIEKAIYHNNRRQGISITNAKNIYLKECLFSLTNGTSPQCGIDLESNNISDFLQNINITSCKSMFNRQLGYYVNGNTNLTNPVTITFTDCEAEGNYGDYGVDNNMGTKGLVTFKNCRSLSSQLTGYSSKQSDLKVDIDGMYIYNPNQSSNTSARYASGLSIANDNASTTVGNLRVRNLDVDIFDGKALATVALVSVGGVTNNNISNIDIEYKSNAPLEKQVIKTGAGTKFTGQQRVVRTDEVEYTITSNVGSSNAKTYIQQKINNLGATSTLTVFVDATDLSQNGNTLEFEVLETQYLQIRANNAVAIDPYGVINILRSNTVGSRVKIVSSNGRWKIIEQIGTWETSV